jgi:exodeoxyribonuclease V alpha subunit
MPIIYGFLERITYYNEENDFLVAKLQEKGKKELTTIVGNLSGINPGESLKLSGKWIHNKKFGEQFQVETFEVTVPATVHGIKKYLGSGLIKGIGPVMAERITKKFALGTLDVIEKTPERLSEVEGIGPKRKIWEAIDYLTRRDGEEYDLFIERIKGNPLTRKVKIADLQDNLDLGRIREPTEKIPSASKKTRGLWQN